MVFGVIYGGLYLSSNARLINETRFMSGFHSCNHNNLIVLTAMKEQVFIKVSRKALIYLMLVLFTFSFSFGDFAVGKAEALEGLKQATNEGFNANIQEDGTGTGIVTDFPTAIGKILGSILAFVGVFFFILMIYGGFVWMFARGNDQDVTKAKGIIESAIIGLIIVLSAYAITSFIGGALTS